MILIKPKDQSATKTLLVLVGRGPGRPQCENDTGGCSTLFLMGGGGRANLELSMSRGRLQSHDFHIKSCSDIF